MNIDKVKYINQKHKTVSWNSFFFITGLLLCLFFRLAGLQSYLLIAMIVLTIFVSMRAQFRVKIDVQMLIISIYALLISLISKYMFSSLNSTRYMVTHLIAVVYPIWLFSMQLSKTIKFEDYVKGIKAIMPVFLLFGLLEIVTGTNIINSIFNIESSPFLAGRISSAFSHPIIYANMISIHGLCCIYSPYKKKAFNVLNYALIFLNILFTQSRSSFVSISILIVLGYIFSRSKRVKRKITRFVIALVLMLIIASVMDRFFKWGIISSFYNRLATIFDFQSQGIRIGAIRLLSQSFKESPIFFNIAGHGCGYSKQYIAMYPLGSYGQWNTTVDNQYVTYILDYGLILVVFCIWSLYQSIKVFIRSRDMMSKEFVVSSTLIILGSSLLFYEGLNWPIVILEYAINTLFLKDLLKMDIINIHKNVRMLDECKR